MNIVTRRVVTRGVNKGYVVVPEGVTHIDDFSFFLTFQDEECKIQHVELPSTLQSVGENAFASCSSLLSMDFSKCARLSYIGKDAFSQCRNLRHVDLSKCTSLTVLSRGVFSGCEKLVLHVPRRLRYSVRCFTDVKLVGLVNYSDSATDMQTLMLPSSVRSQMVSRLLSQARVIAIYSVDHDRYADVFDALGRLNVLWVESLRRQSAYRNTNQWNRSIILAESEIKNYVLELWSRVQPYDTQNMFRLSSDIVREGLRLVQMRSYQRQPEETKLFKEILVHFNILEPQRLRPPTPVGRSKRPRRLADLRL